MKLQKMTDKAAEALVKTYGATSVQYALIDNGEITVSGSQGVFAKDNNRLITKDTMYGIGSVSKVYVAASVMMLVDWGKVNIDDPYIKYVPEFKMADDRYSQITVRMLLNHSSGINGTSFGNMFLFNTPSSQLHDDLLNILATQTLKADPGEFSAYTNDGITLLEIMVERISGLSFTQFIEQKISRPLGLQYTKTPLDNFDRTELAKTYYPLYDGVMPTDVVDGIGTGGIYSTAEEVCKFANVLMGNTDLLSKESAMAMQNEEYRRGIWIQEDENFFAFGLGWDSVHTYPFAEYNISAVFKGGDTFLYHSALVAIPEYHIAMVINSSGGSSIQSSSLAATILQEVLKEKGIIKEIKPVRTFEKPEKQNMPDGIKKYSGVYIGASFANPKTIDVLDGEIEIPALISGYIPAQKFIYTGNGDFKSEDGSVTVHFDDQSNGNTYLKVSMHFTFPEVGQAVLTTYEAQKLEKNVLNDNVAIAWKKRVGKNFLMLTEKSSSQLLYIPTISSKLPIDIESGYVMGSKIIDENNAVNAVQMPIGGRETTEIKFYTEDNKEYLHMYNITFINEDSIQSIIQSIKKNENAVVTIQADGYACWYRINEATADKIMVVQIPANASFAVYDENFVCVDFSTVSGNDTVILPINGYIGFFGKTGEEFIITLS